MDGGKTGDGIPNTILDQALASLPPGPSLCELILQNFAGELLMLADRPDDALQRYRMSDAASRPDADPWWRCSALVNRSITELMVGDLAGGLDHARIAQAITHSADMTSSVGSSSAVVAHAAALALAGNRRDAAIMLLDHCSALEALTRIEAHLSAPLPGVALLAALDGDMESSSQVSAFFTATTFGIPWQQTLVRKALAITEASGYVASDAIPDLPEVRKVSSRVLRRMSACETDAKVSQEVSPYTPSGL